MKYVMEDECQRTAMACMEVEKKRIEKEKVWDSQSTATASTEAAAVLDKMDDESCDYTTVK